MNKMKILHFGTLDVKAGGPAMSTYLTLLGLQHRGVDTTLAMYLAHTEQTLIGNDVPVCFCQKPWENTFAYSSTLKNELSAIDDIDIYHAQGIWQYPTYALVDIARKKNKPYLITPRGMLYPQDINKSKPLLKKLSLNLRLRKDLNNAACVHVTCEEEMQHCRTLGITAPIAIIPNPVEIKDYKSHDNNNVFRVGYLGRFSKRKNIELLLYSFAELKLQDAELVLIGSGDNDYEEFLRAECKRLGLKRVIFTGFLSGEEKDKVLASLSIVVMPSEFENLGNVILEGLVRGIPCIATKGTPWKDLDDYNCGWWIDYSQEAVTKAIAEAYSTDKALLRAMGENGKRLMSEKYSVEAVSQKMLLLYEWITHKGVKPDFVYE